MEFNVLVVDDHEGVQRLLSTALRRLGVENILQAYSLEDAQNLFAESSGDIHGMIVDGNLGHGHEQSGVTFVREVRKEGFTGPIVASSVDGEINLEMMLSGANGMIPDFYKGHAPELLMDLLEN